MMQRPGPRRLRPSVRPSDLKRNETGCSSSSAARRTSPFSGTGETSETTSSMPAHVACWRTFPIGRSAPGTCFIRRAVLDRRRFPAEQNAVADRPGRPEHEIQLLDVLTLTGPDRHQHDRQPVNAFGIAPADLAWCHFLVCVRGTVANC